MHRDSGRFLRYETVEEARQALVDLGKHAPNYDLQRRIVGKWLPVPEPKEEK